MSTPTQRSLQKLRKDGWFVEVVEKWVPATPQGYKGNIIRKDLFGFCDLLAVKGDVVLLVQTTSNDNLSARLQKILALPIARYWLTSDSRKIVVHGWAKKGARERRKLWECREVPVTLQDFENVAI